MPAPTTDLLRAGDLPLTTLVGCIRARLAQAACGDTITIEAIDPDLFPGLYNGEHTKVDGTVWVYRDYRTWMDLAEGLHCAMCTPRQGPPGRVWLRLRKLRPSGWHQQAAPSGDPEKYGVHSEYSRTRRVEEPSLLLGLEHCLHHLSPPQGASILALGCNQGDELSLVDALLTQRQSPPRLLVGIDHCPSAIAAGRQRFTDPRYKLLCADISAPLPVHRFDVVLAIHCLHSRALDGTEVLSRILKEHRTPAGGVVIGLPSSRHEDRRLRFGTSVRHVGFPEHSVLLKQAMHFRRLLQRRGHRVILTGKHTLLLAATPST